MQIEFDPSKNISNHAKHGLYLSDAIKFEWDSAYCVPDNRADYRETRMTCIGRIGDRLHVVVYTERSNARRVISLRKANSREVKRYVHET